MTVYAPPGQEYVSVGTLTCQHENPQRSGFSHVLAPIDEITCTEACETYLVKRHGWWKTKPLDADVEQSLEEAPPASPGPVRTTILTPVVLPILR